MSYYNNNRGGYGGRSYGNNYGRSNYGGQRQYNGGGYNNQRQQQPSKKSWAVYGTIRKGNFIDAPYIIGFKKTKNGLLKASVMPYEKSRIKKSQSGNEYLPMMCTIYLDGVEQSHFPVLYSKTTRKVVLEKMGMVITPNGSGRLSSGKSVSGYFGKNYRS